MLPEKDLCVFESTHWKVVLNPNQTYLGRCVVVLKRECGNLPDLLPTEWGDLHAVIKRMEKVIRNALGATMFNWSCFMNHAYREFPPKPQVHWHVLPRYGTPVDLGDLHYTDPNFGDRPVETSTILSDEKLGLLVSLLKESDAKSPR